MTELDQSDSCYRVFSSEPGLAGEMQSGNALQGLRVTESRQPQPGSRPGMAACSPRTPRLTYLFTLHSCFAQARESWFLPLTQEDS